VIDLTGKHILICGGSRGIGAATARMAARAGASVSINYLTNVTAADAVVSEIEGLGQKSLSIQGDLSNPDDAKKVITTATAGLGELAGLVISAGIFQPGPIDEMSPEFWDRNMAINVRATFLAVQAAAPSLRKNGGGSIVIYTSTAGQRGSDIYSAYATAKGAQIMFMRSMARELAPDHIRSNCVAPGWTETDMSKGPLDEIGRENVIPDIPLGRIGQPEDPAGAALFLLSDLAQFVTGSTITVDGGYDMRG
jgi:3-oxoacyl-[acyl-carrier protein] reductase